MESTPKYKKQACNFTIKSTMIIQVYIKNDLQKTNWRLTLATSKAVKRLE